jgi:hypothetical protein
MPGRITIGDELRVLHPAEQAGAGPATSAAAPTAVETATA